MCKKDRELRKRGLPPMHCPCIDADGNMVAPTFSYERDPDNQPSDGGDMMPPIIVRP